jgi:hypothetical protein
MVRQAGPFFKRMEIYLNICVLVGNETLHKLHKEKLRIFNTTRILFFNSIYGMKDQCDQRLFILWVSKNCLGLEIFRNFR